MRDVVFDVEGNDLLPGLHTIHSLVLRDLESGEVVSCTDASPEYPSIEHGLSLLSEAERLYGHNIIAYDIPALQKIFPGWTYKGRLLDTLLICQMRWAHIKDTDYRLHEAGTLPPNLIGRHSLEAWGHRIGMPKIQYDGGFEHWNPEMQTYCEGDVEVNAELVYMIRKAGIPGLAVEIEQSLRPYLVAQEENGWPFDVGAAQELYATLAAEREEIAQRLRERFGWWYVGNGEVTPKRSMVRRKGVPIPQEITEGCPYTKLKQVEFKPSSRQHIAKVLIEQFDWKPKQFTNSGLPEVSEKTLENLSDKCDAKPDLMRFLMLDKRIGQLAEGKKAWLKVVVEDSPAAKKLGVPMIHHSVWQNFCITSRAAHRNPNLGQVPSAKSEYGPEMRALFYAPPGWDMLGADASGLELRCMAHYQGRWDNGRYAEQLLKHDIHNFNRDMLEFDGKDARDDSKTFSYALIYGAGDAKLGSIRLPGGSERKRRTLGKKLRALYERKLPAFKYLVKWVRGQYRNRQYIRLIDGRRAYPRSEHSALNTLLQGTGSVVCKLWIVRFAAKLEAEFGPQGWDGQWAAMGWIHDEVQLATRPEITERVGEILVETIREVGEELKFNLPLDGEYKVGRTWRETH
jgi:DNA polymerase I-like protein with 3'-5' exonuclease and polymerase domains